MKQVIGLNTGIAMLMLVAAPPGLANGDSWAFQLTPYAWLAGVKGEVGAAPGEPPAPIDISARDAIEDVEATLMLIFSARLGRHGAYADIFYGETQSDVTLLPSPIDLKVRVRAENLLLSLAYQYRFFENERASADVLAGARYWEMDTRLSFRGGAGFLEGRTVKSNESWTDPIVGVKGSTPLGDSRFYVSGGAALGGFGVGSDRFYEISGNIGYQWNDAIGTAIGYRMFDVDYRDSGFSYDVRQQGWQFGLTWAF